ncbi:MAG: tRNA (cytosine(32)/uridine(32)-2'-O)-methyltransferase TrmJ [endosymbiont of Galathealinum brachiosum]|uniref:tRNA (cytidine/uridine-2'-O-)-methyltransferase TrmJ n=1 Tax=endosymbiont of Galathealinum brachiosum TaxID=2200906 RepID=A0A370DI62_9GAMM|nr:MAG: tRNA (cytosine(32)/uridine(32)-2'-O)-methyltransferase TrmJ [endosymbiont of Galathealinum brachiosum]
MLDNIRIVLVNTHHPGNIGSAARAMKNMGITRLYLVEPKNFPSFEASQLASSATDVLKNAVVVDTLAEALKGCSFVCGTTARLRSVKWPQVDGRECGELIHHESEQHEVALVFGRERSGLSNDELELCQTLVNITTGEAYSSLNLGQAVQVLSYEILMASRKDVVEPAKQVASVDEKDELATNDQLEGMYNHYMDALSDLNFFGKRNPEHIMRKLRCLYGRARPTLREVQIMRGILSYAQGRRTQTPEK